MRKLITFLFLIIFVFSITGCGGTNGTSANGNASGVTSQAQGVYSGFSSTGKTFESIVLPNDKYYALYGTTTGNIFTIEGMIAGQGQSKSGQFTAPVTDYYYTGSIYSGSLKASYSPGASINGTVSETGNNSPAFTGTVLPTTSFNYDAPASISDIAGTWNGNLLGNLPATISITSTGIVSGYSNGCSFSGTVVPDSSQKNFFDFTLTYGGSPCLMPYQAQTGIAIQYLLSDGVTRQLVGGVSSGLYGNVFVANSKTNPVSNLPKFVQQSSYTSPTPVPINAPATSTYTASFRSPVTKGDLIAVAFWWNRAPGSSQIISVTDSAGNTYRPVLQAYSSYNSDRSAWIYAATNVAGGNNVAVTVRVGTASTAAFSMATLEYANVSSLDAISRGTGPISIPETTTTAVTSRPNELILGVSVADVNVTAGSGFNSRFTSPYFCVEDKFVTASGQYSAQFNSSSSIANGGWNAGMATFY